MKLKIENQIFEFDNTEAGITTLFAKIEEVVESSSKVLSHMRIDYMEIYDDYYSYFKDNIHVIREVEVVTLAYKELVEDILSSTVEYLNKAIPLTEELSSKFYREPLSGDWKGLKDLLEGISWIISTFSSIDGDDRLGLVVESYESWNDYATSIYDLQDIIEEFMDVMENQDNVAIADLLRYEITPKFEMMSENLSPFVPVSGGTHVS